MQSDDQIGTVKPQPSSNERIDALLAEIKQLNQQVSSIDTRVRRISSIRASFGIAVVRGVGYALGATVVVSLLAALIARTLESIDYVPMVSQFFDSPFFQQIQAELNSL